MSITELLTGQNIHIVLVCSSNIEKVRMEKAFLYNLIEHVCYPLSLVIEAKVKR